MKVIFQGFLLSLIALISCNAQSPVPDHQGIPGLGAGAKGVLKGEQVTIPVYDFDGLEDLLDRSEDRIYVVNFWATWCKPCIEELPYFEELQARYSSGKVQVILVSLDFPARAEKLLIPFAEKWDLKSTVILLDDPKQNTWIPRISESWSGSIPATLFLTRDKREFHERSFNFKELEMALSAFIN